MNSRDSSRVPLTLVEKIAAHHVVAGPRPCRSGDFVQIRPRHVFTHDNTAAVINKFRTLSVQRIFDPLQPVIALDHDIQNHTPENLGSYAKIDRFAREHGLVFYGPGTGIGHQLVVERGFARPGTMVVASDSHANMYGAVGCLGTPVVRTDAAAIWATGSTWWRVPRVARVTLRNSLAVGASGKDVILALCGLVNSDQVLNHAVEFVGAGVASLLMSDRMSIANMTTEWGALAGVFPVDDVTLQFLREIDLRPENHRAGSTDTTAQALTADADASYAVEIELDLSRVSPMVTGPNDVKCVTSLVDLEARRVRITKAYLLSCVNARYEDLAQAASVLSGARVAAHVELYIAAASSREQERAERDGTWQTLLAAGARALPSGCGPCIGLGSGILLPGDVAISATNRNYRGRMGSPEATTYLASPAVVAASACAGYICGPSGAPSNTPPERLDIRVRSSVPPKPALDPVPLVPGFERSMVGRTILLARPDISTDAIYAGRWTYTPDMTSSKMAQVLFENYDATFHRVARPGDVLVAGHNFGTGSSREQAATGLQAFGIRAVIAASVSATFERNALNNSFVILESPECAAALLGGESRAIAVGPMIEIDFAQSLIRWGDRSFAFLPLGPVAQQLIVAGGIENLLRAQRGLESSTAATAGPAKESVR